MREINCIILGDYPPSEKLLTKLFGKPDDYLFEIPEDLETKVVVCDEEYLLKCCFILFTMDYDGYRVEHYKGHPIDLFVFTFGLGKKSTFSNIKDHWIQHSKDLSPKTPALLIGLINENQTRVISPEEIENLKKKEKFLDYLEFDLNNENNINRLRNKIVLTSLISKMNIKVPKFFQAFQCHPKEMSSFIKKAVLVSQGNFKGESPFFRLPNEIMIFILHLCGSGLGDEKSLKILTLLIFGNVSDRYNNNHKLEWKRNITLNNQTIQVYDSPPSKCVIS